MNATILHAKRLNHGQSEVYLESNGKESAHRILATNELFIVAAHHCAHDDFAAFHKTLQVKVGEPAMLTGTCVDEIAVELQLMQ